MLKALRCVDTHTHTSLYRPINYTQTSKNLLSGFQLPLNDEVILFIKMTDLSIALTTIGVHW